MSNPGTLAGVTHIVAVHSAKGGVGKSTVTVNLAVGLARRGLRVGLLDADVHGPSAPTMMGTGEWPDPGPSENLILPIEAHGIKFISMGNMVTRQTPLIWRGAMVTSAITQLFNNVVWGDLDVLLIDMPPGTGDAQLSISQSVPLTGAIVISTPQELAMIDSLRGLQAFLKLKVPVLGLVENMSAFVCDSCGDIAALFGASGVEIIAEELGLPLLGRIPLETAVCDGADQGRPVVLTRPDSPAGRAFESVGAKLAQELETRKPSFAFRLEWRDMGWDERNAEPPGDNFGVGPVKAIWQVSNDELGIKWDDDKISTISTRALRLACPCAACIDEWTGEAILKPETVPADIRIQHLHSVGRYGIQPKFTDNHSSGIFHFDRLKKLTRG